MARLRIYDLREHVQALELDDLLRLLAPQSLRANWTISPVKSSIPGHEWFEATGEGGEQLEALAQANARLPGAALVTLAGNTSQVIWGEFVGSLPEEPARESVTIRAADSTFYEVETDDEAVINKINSTYDDVREGEAPIESWALCGPSG